MLRRSIGVSTIAAVGCQIRRLLPSTHTRHTDSCDSLPTARVALRSSSGSSVIMSPNINMMMRATAALHHPWRMQGESRVVMVGRITSSVRGTSSLFSGNNGEKEVEESEESTKAAAELQSHLEALHDALLGPGRIDETCKSLHDFDEACVPALNHGMALSVQSMDKLSQRLGISETNWQTQDPKVMARFLESPEHTRHAFLLALRCILLTRRSAVFIRTMYGGKETPEASIEAARRSFMEAAQIVGNVPSSVTQAADPPAPGDAATLPPLPIISVRGTTSPDKLLVAACAINQEARAGRNRRALQQIEAGLASLPRAAEAVSSMSAETRHLVAQALDTMLSISACIISRTNGVILLPAVEQTSTTTSPEATMPASVSDLVEKLVDMLPLAKAAHVALLEVQRQGGPKPGAPLEISFRERLITVDSYETGRAVVELLANSFPNECAPESQKKLPPLDTN